MLTNGAALALSALTASGCYTGFQTTSSIVQSAPIDDANTGQTLSYQLHTYDVTGGVTSGRLEVFTGGGLGSQRVHVRNGSATQSSDESAFRFHFGASLMLARLGAVRLRGFAIYGTQTAGLLGDDLELTQLSSSYEGGLQVSAIMPSESFYWEPLFRIGVAAQTGATEPELYQNTMGTSDFDGVAATATIGVNFGFTELFDD